MNRYEGLAFLKSIYATKDKSKLERDFESARLLLGDVLSDYDKEKSDGVYIDDIETKRAERIREFLKGAAK